MQQLYHAFEWRDFLEAHRQSILDYWPSSRHVLRLEDIDDLHRKLTDRMWNENAARGRHRACVRGGLFPEEVSCIVQAFL